MRVRRTTLPNGREVERTDFLFWQHPQLDAPVMIPCADYDTHFLYRVEDDKRGASVMCTCGAPAIVRMDEEGLHYDVRVQAVTRQWSCMHMEQFGYHQNVGEGWQ